MAIPYRKEKLASQIAKEVSQILLTELRDPRAGFLTVTRVTVSDDYRYAKVFVSVMGSEKEKRLTMAGLESAQGFVQHQLSRRIAMRYVPEISFVRDDSIEKTMKLTQLLDELAAKRSPKPKKAAPKKRAPTRRAKPSPKAKPAREDAPGGSEEE